MLKKRWAAIFVAVTSFAALSGNALAAPAQAPPTADPVGPQVRTAAVVGARASASDIATGRVTVLAFVNAKGLSRVERQDPACKRVSGVWNSGKGQDGRLYWFWDTRTIRVCPSKKSPTGWARDVCANPVRTTKPPKRVVKGEVLLVRSFAQIKVRLHAEAKVRVTAVCGWAEASASSSVTVGVKAWIRSRGESLNSLFAVVSGSATAEASARLECVTAPPPAPEPPKPQPPTPQPPPPTPPPTCPPGQTGTPPNCKVSPPPPPANQPPVVDVSPIQHVFENGQVQICGTATDPDGDRLAVSFTATRGTVSAVFENGRDRFCVTYTAPATAGDVTVTMIASDGKESRSASTTFPVVKDDF